MTFFSLCLQLTWSIKHHQDMLLLLKKSFECFICKVFHLAGDFTPIFLWRRGRGWLLWTGEMKTKFNTNGCTDIFLFIPHYLMFSVLIELCFSGLKCFTHTIFLHLGEQNWYTYIFGTTCKKRTSMIEANKRLHP